MTNKLIAECCDRVGEVYATTEPAEFAVKLTNARAAEALANMQRGFLTPIDREALRMAESALRVQREVTHEALTDKIANMLSLTYHCTRVWSAWNVGTMSQDDFEPVDESDTPSEIATEILAMLNAVPHPQGEEHGQD
jgi:hypothetical protein